MKKLSRFLSSLSALFGLLTIVRSPKGVIGSIMWLPKLWAGAWSPFFAVAGALGALLGLGRKDRAAILFGMFGMFAGIRHTRIVTQKHRAFESAFGEDWQQRIPSEMKARAARRYQFIQPDRKLGRFQKDINIGGATPLFCDVWMPPDNVKRSHLGVIFFHGSLWQAVDKDFGTRPLFARLVNQGHVVMDVAYSLAPTSQMPQMVDDAKRAIAWMKDNAERLNLDPTRIVLMGSSGGAHLAMLSAYTPNFPTFQPQGITTDTSVRGVISIFGVTDLTSYYHEYGLINPRQPEYSWQLTADMQPYIHDKTWIERFLTHTRAFPEYRYKNIPGGPGLLPGIFGGTPKEIPEIYKLYSPTTYVGAHCPPTMQMFGDNDFVISTAQGRLLHEALQKAGAISVYIEFPDTVHAFDQYFGVSRRVAPAAQVASYDIENFLALMV
jgi:acetyl esterase/lipase